MNPDRFSPPGFDQALTDTRRLWKFALGSPIIYLLMGWMFVALEWIDPSADTARPHDNAMTQALFLLAAATIVATLAGMTWRRTRLPVSVRIHPEEAIGRWVRNFYIRLSLCDSLAFLGLFYYILSARTWALLAGGAAAYAAYLLVYPRQGDGKDLME